MLMTFLRDIGGGIRACFRFSFPVTAILILSFCLTCTMPAQGESAPPYQVELRISDDSMLQLVDNQGKTWFSLPKGTVRKRATVQNLLFLASFGEDSQHHSVVVLSLDISADQPATFLLGRHILVISPEATVTLQVSPDRSTVQVSPSLMGQVRFDGVLVERGEVKKVALGPSRSQGKGLVPSPSQPKPTTKDFNSIPVPSL